MPHEADLTFVHTNDLHGSLSADWLDLIHEAAPADALRIDSGDVIKTGNLGVPLRPEPIWPLMGALGIQVGTIGNRETHVLESAFRAKIDGAPYPLLCANLVWRHTRERVLPAHLVLESRGRRVGFIGVSVPMVTETMSTRHASAFLWENPVASVRPLVEELRSQVDVLAVVSHLGFRKDQELADAIPGIDLIFGGHSHTVLETPFQQGGTWIVQGGSHGRYFGLYRFDIQTRILEGALQPWKERALNRVRTHVR